MKVFGRESLIIVMLVVMSYLTSCSDNTAFSLEDLRYVEAYKENNVVIYKSELGQLDTITFLKYHIDTIEFRNYNQGFYNQYILRVDYMLSENSFHKFTVMEVGKSSEYLIEFVKVKGTGIDKEMYFLGMLFNEKYLDRKVSQSDSVVVFSQKNAQYNGLNINEGIESFTFDFKKGIVSFVDENNNEWMRVN